MTTIPFECKNSLQISRKNKQTPKSQTAEGRAERERQIGAKERQTEKMSSKAKVINALKDDYDIIFLAIFRKRNYSVKKTTVILAKGPR